MHTEWGPSPPTPTEIDGIHLANVSCDELLKGIEVRGDKTKKVRNLTFRDVRIGKVCETVKVGTWEYGLEPGEVRQPIDIRDAEAVRLENVTVE